jgi:hypothetical protein
VTLDNLVKKQIIGGLMIYFIIRVFAYYYSPGTPLYSANPVNWILSTCILLSAIYFLWKKDQRGWLIIAGEMILGGAGGFFEIKSISLRTLLLIFSIVIFGYQTIKDKQWQIFFENKIVLYLLSGIFLIAGVSALRGYYHSHALSLIIADIIPYFFFLYYFPLKQLIASDKFRQIVSHMIISAIVGSFIFTFFTLAGFSLHLFVLQDNYYHWFRDVASGKITEYGFNFYRINLNEHLLLIPLLILFLGKIINKKMEKIALPMPFLLLGILSANLTRIFILAMGAGLLFLFSKINWKRWLLYSTATVVGFFLIFTSIHLVASRGQSLGWEFFGLRLQSIALPQTEDSSLSRLKLLPKILDKIKKYPILGTGLGDTVTIFSPIFKTTITTPHFDWGYLEIMAETGIIGMIIWILLIGYCLFKTPNWTLRASLLSLLVINLTSPALFHVLGIVLIVFILANNFKSALLPKPQA